MRTRPKLVVWIISILLLGFAVGCKKKTPVVKTPAAPKVEAKETPRPNAPAIEFSAEPGSIERGQSALLRWKVQDATSVEINNGVGAISASGEHRVSPNESTTYTLMAKGPGGETTAEASLNVTAPPPPAPAAAATKSIGDRLASDVQDAFFDFDKSAIREDARAALTKDAEALKSILTDFPNTNVVVEGHCDERGSAEYNLALGARRANSVKDFLTQLGVAAERLVPVSYGKERPQCTEQNESCWQKNRRAHFAAGENQKPTQTTELATPETQPADNGISDLDQ